MLVEDEPFLCSEQKGFELVSDELGFGDFDGILPASKQTQWIVPDNDFLSLVTVTNEIRALQVIHQIDEDIYKGDEEDGVVFGKGWGGFLKPWNEDNHDNGDGKDDGHDQPAEPNAVSIALIVNFHLFFSFDALF
jgi:hypothetical protein